MNNKAKNENHLSELQSISSDEFIKTLKFGIVSFLKEYNLTPMDRDLLQQDFQEIEIRLYLKTGSSIVSDNNNGEFKLKVYAPYGFRYLRQRFGTSDTEFMVFIYYN